MLSCSVCGGTHFSQSRVLWPELVAEWQLASQEVDYIDAQQGRNCTACGANLRIIALGTALREAFDTDATVAAFADDHKTQNLRILDINGCAGLSVALAKLGHYIRADYPAVDMQALPYPAGSFDLVIHSDTLEHLPHPVRALEECRRVLATDGRLCFTIPVIVGRLTRSRAGLPHSYHGNTAMRDDDFLVHTEFGADAWTWLMKAGFQHATVSQIDYPVALAFTAWNKERPVTLPPDKPVAVAAPLPPEAPETAAANVYDQDGLRTTHNHEFMHDQDFLRAYARGVQAVGLDYQWHWRVHVGLYAARTAAHLPGDFVECGVNRGFMSSAIMELLDWNQTGRMFFLLDTFAGIDERYISPDEKQQGMMERNERDIKSGFYTFDIDDVRRNFAQWPNTKIIVGPIPETLQEISSQKFAFVHLDLNCSPPEVAALDWLWDRIVPGGIVLLDDYAYTGYRSQKLGMDGFARARGVSVLSLPTGQGMIVKPPPAKILP